jgi:hypothetical protein
MSPLQRSLAPILAGILLVFLGVFFLWVNLYGLEVQWVVVVTYGLPLLLLSYGLYRIANHFLRRHLYEPHGPRAPHLLSGVFWAFVGSIWLLHAFGSIDGLRFFGQYWPALLILFGLVKIADYYITRGGRFRVGELFGIIFIILIGLAATRAAEAQVRLMGRVLPFSANWPILAQRTQAERHRFEETERLPAEGIKRVSITNQHGDVSVRTLQSEHIEIGIARIVTGEPEEESRQLAERLRLQTRRDGETLYIEVTRDDLPEQARLNSNLRVTVPAAATAITISNTYGEVDVASISGNCDIENSYGRVRLTSIEGDVNVKNRYQGISAKRITGKFLAENRRGEVDVEDVIGDVGASTDYSSLKLKGINGNVLLHNHHGSIRVERVTGTVEIKGAGSSVRVADVIRGLKVENSHKSIDIEDIGEQVEVDTSYSRLNVSRITGPVIIRALHSQVKAQKLQAGVKVQGQGTQVSFSEIEGPVSVATSLRDVTIRRFRGAADIQNEYGPITINPEGPLSGPLVASNRNGEIRLSLPSQASFRLSAQAPGGQIFSEFGSAEEGSTRQVVEQTIGDGKPEVRLQTTYSKITVQKR